MAIRHKVGGYDEFDKLIKELSDTKQRVFVLFTGKADSAGKSWCPDCNTAEPAIERAIASILDNTTHFVKVEIERSLWKDPNNQFRKDQRLRLTCVPTLMMWGGAQKLGDNQCANEELVELLFQTDKA